MPRTKLPDLTDVDLAELQLAVLAIFEQHHMDPEFRRTMHTQLGALLEVSGGARRVLREALAAIRRNGSK
jgi:hypothetical protein